MLKHIPFYAVLVNKELGEGLAKQSHVLIYGAIEAHSFGDEGCIASNKLISEETGISESRTASIISELSTAGWIRVTLNGLRQRILIEPLLVISFPQPDGLPHMARGFATHGNIEHSIEHNLNDSANALSKKKVNPEVQEVLDYWVAATNYKLKGTPAEQKTVKALVKDHGLQRVKDFIKVAAAFKADQYCPVITSFKQLESKWYNLEAYGIRKQSQQLQRSVTITE